MLSSLRAQFLGRDETRVIVVGLDGSGKTTIVYRLKSGNLSTSDVIRALLSPAQRHASLTRTEPAISAARAQPPSASTASASSTARSSSRCGIWAAPLMLVRSGGYTTRTRRRLSSWSTAASWTEWTRRGRSSTG